MKIKLLVLLTLLSGYAFADHHEGDRKPAMFAGQTSTMEAVVEAIDHEETPRSERHVDAVDAADDAVAAFAEDESLESIASQTMSILSDAPGVGAVASVVEIPLQLLAGFARVASELPIVGPAVTVLRGLFQVCSEVNALQEVVDRFRRRVECLSATVLVLVQEVLGSGVTATSVSTAVKTEP